MTKSAATKLPHSKAWSKPKLERLGMISDVAGARSVNNNGSSSNPRS